jgi:hypothetical protein
MKMLPEHYDILKNATMEALADNRVLLTPEIAKGEYKRANLSATRFYFDCFYRAMRYAPQRFDSTLYQYMNDSHIHTAMRKILGEY